MGSSRTLKKEKRNKLLSIILWISAIVILSHYQSFNIKETKETLVMPDSRNYRDISLQAVNSVEPGVSQEQEHQENVQQQQEPALLEQQEATASSTTMNQESQQQQQVTTDKEIEAMEGRLDETKINYQSNQLQMNQLQIDIVKDDVGLISRMHKLMYIRIPRTGGKAFEQSSLFNDAMAFAQQGLRSRVRGHHLLSDMMVNANERHVQDFTTAATVRHPCARFISAFEYLKNGGGNEGDRQAALEMIGERTIDEYVEYLDSQDWNVPFMGHFNMQYPFLIMESDDFGIDVVMCHEHWNEGVERFESALGVKGLVPRISAADLLLKENQQVEQHRTCQDLQPATRGRLQKHYALDYCLFGYEELPEYETGTCVGTDMTKSSFTEKFKDCRRQILG